MAKERKKNTKKPEDPTEPVNSGEMDTDAEDVDDDKHLNKACQAMRKRRDDAAAEGTRMVKSTDPKYHLRIPELAVSFYQANDAYRDACESQDLAPQPWKACSTEVANVRLVKVREKWGLLYNNIIPA